LLSISQVIVGMHITLVHLPVLVQCLMVQQVRNFFCCRSCLATHLCQHLKILFRMQTFKPIAQCSWMMFFIWCFKSFKISVVFSWNFIYNYNPHIYIFATIKCSSS
jgi:hypothetical protein